MEVVQASVAQTQTGKPREAQVGKEGLISNNSMTQAPTQHSN